MVERRVRGVLAVLTVLGLSAGCASGPHAGTSGSSTPSTATSSTHGAPPPVAATSAAASSTPAPKPNPCASNRHGKLVRVSLHKQQLWMCARTRLVRSTPITSGIPGEYTSTPTGKYTIQGRDRDTVLTLITGDQYSVKYWIPFDAPLFGFHDSSWQDFPYGSQRYKKEGSHGCIHMPLRAIAFLYHWAEVGTKVHIRV